MHEHWSIPKWVRVLSEVEGREEIPVGCPEAKRAWAEDISPWLDHVAHCARCRKTARTARAPGPVPARVLDCPECRCTLEVVHRMVEELEHFDPAIALELPRSEALLDALDPLPFERQVETVRNDPNLHRWGLCQRLLAEAQEGWFRDPGAARERAVLAREIADRLPVDSYHPRWVADLQAKAHGYLANSLRILGSVQEAEAEIERADRRLHSGVGSGRGEARILSFAATLRTDQHRHRDAVALLDQVEALSLVRRSLHQRARNSMRRARVLHAAGRLTEAADECTGAALHLDPAEEPRLVGMIQQNAVHYLARAGQPRPAREFFDTLPPTDDHMILIRRKWVEAHLLRAESRPWEARECFDATRGAFLEAGLPYDGELVERDRQLVAR